VEDVSPVPSPDDGGGIIEYAGECTTVIMSQIYSLLGVESEARVVPNRPRRSSTFVQELRRKVVEFHVVDDDNDDGRKASSESITLPPLQVKIIAPQVKSSFGKSLAEALERGFRSSLRQEPFPVIRVETAESNFGSRSDSLNNALCDNFQLPIQSKPNGDYPEPKFPEIIVLMGCSSVSIPDKQLSLVKVDQNSGTLVVRTVLTSEQKNEVRRHLEDDVSHILSSEFFVPLSNSSYSVESVSINLIDENPASHADGSDGASGITAKLRFDTLGNALSSAVQSTIGPILKDLSFIYGGNILANDDAWDVIQGNVVNPDRFNSLAVHSSAYLSLPEDAIKFESSDGMASGKYVSSHALAKLIFAHSRKRTESPGDVKWVLFVPSLENTPLKVYDELSGRKGESIILSSPPQSKDGGRIKKSNLNGMSVVNNIPSFTGEVDLGEMYSGYRDGISLSLTYLVGYIRAIHGFSSSAVRAQAKLSSVTSVKYDGDSQEIFTFWELESIARIHFSSSLEAALLETDSLMALLHQHSGTLALPGEVARKLNNATRLLRQSISLAEKGFPTMYCSSQILQSLQLLRSVQNDHRLVELPYFAPDHYLAVFSPLVLPLLLPMIVGLIREVKRFQRLRKK